MDELARFYRTGLIESIILLVLVLLAFGGITILARDRWLALGITESLLARLAAAVLIGAVAVTKFQRVYEAAIFKTLGASTRTIARMLLLEYGVLGSLAGLVGSMGAIALTWGVTRYALDMPWRIFPREHVAGVVLTAFLVATIGVLSSLDVLRNKPLATLRAE